MSKSAARARVESKIKDLRRVAVEQNAVGIEVGSPLESA